MNTQASIRSYSSMLTAKEKYLHDELPRNVTTGPLIYLTELKYSCIQRPMVMQCFKKSNTKICTGALARILGAGAPLARV